MIIIIIININQQIHENLKENSVMAVQTEVA